MWVEAAKSAEDFTSGLSMSFVQMFDYDRKLNIAAFQD